MWKQYSHNVTNLENQQSDMYVRNVSQRERMKLMMRGILGDKVGVSDKVQAEDDKQIEEDLHFLEKVIEECRPFSEKGKLASYIPILAHANKHALGITVQRIGKQAISAGDCYQKFTLQSISKIFTLLLALMDRGEEQVFAKVGKEPTGDMYDSMLKLEMFTPGKPFNPLINAGAIAVTDLIAGKTKEEKFTRILNFIRLLSNDHAVGWNEQVYLSEAKTSSRNHALAYLLQENGIIGEDVEQPLDVYFKQCSIEVTCAHLARMAVILANNGVNPDTGDELIPKRYVQIVKTFMVTCGMYNASGEFAIEVGLPAKSGVSGGIIALVPGKMGIGVIGPALDNNGNSVAGIRVLQRLSRKWELSMF